MSKITQKNREAKSFILMAAIPPTLGHIDLINFAKNLTGNAVVILVTRGSEPYQEERFTALHAHYAHEKAVEILLFHVDGMDAEGDPYWANVLKTHGFEAGDILVASEDWGGVIATMLDGEFYPYDLHREIRYTRATEIRENIVANWQWIIPEFQKMLQRRIVVLGAESTEKAILLKQLRDSAKDSVAVFDYARQLLDLDPVLDVVKMTAIWKGQKALQATIGDMSPIPRVVFLDNDLYSTMAHWETSRPGTVPAELIEDAQRLEANFYVHIEQNPSEISNEERLTRVLKTLQCVIPESLAHTRKDVY